MSNKEVLSIIKDATQKFANQTERKFEDIFKIEPNFKRKKCPECGSRPRKIIILKGVFPMQGEDGAGNSVILNADLRVCPKCGSPTIAN